MVWYRFAEFELDLDTFVLKRGDRVVPIQPKVFDVLRYLIEHRGKVVTKADLLCEIWRNEYVNENAIAWSVSHIRRALGQRSGRHPIETVLTRGYRFTAEVTEGTSNTLRPPPAAAPEGERESVSMSAALVGRAQVMAELESLVREAASGRGALCVLSGAAGIGKTRCADELAKLAHASGIQVLWGRCRQDPAMPTLWPIVAALRESARDQPAFAARLQELVAGAEGDASLSDDQRSGTRFALIERASRLLRKAASTRPSLLIVDDLHWADVGSLDLLRFIAPELHDTSLCIVATLRDGELQPGSALDEPLRRLLRHARTIPLVAFDTGEVAEYTLSLCSHRPSDALAEAMRRAAGGVPLFVQEIVRALLRDHGATQMEHLAPDVVRTPALARDLLRQRMQRLPATTIDLLSHAAVIGDVFDLSLLLSLVEFEPETLLERLEPALAEGQLQNDAPHRYRFVHALFQSVLYDDLPVARRVAIHRRLGTLLLSRPPDARRGAEIARHFYLSLPAGDHELVMRLAREAGDQAQRSLAYENAIVHYGWALEAQTFGGASDARLRAELLLSLASVQRMAGRTHDALESTSRLLELAQQQRMSEIVVRATRLRRPTVAMAMIPDALARAALESVLEAVPDTANATRISALSQLSCVPPYSSDLGRSKLLSARALELARQLPEPEPTIEATSARLFSLSGPDDVAEVLQVADHMLHTQLRGAPPWQASDAMSARYTAYLLSGRIADADGVLRATNAAIADGHWPEATFYWKRLEVQRRFLDGHLDEAEQRWKTLHARAAAAGVSYADLFYNTFLFNLSLEREGPKVLIARALGPAMAPAAMTPYTRAGLARIAAEAGDHELARGQLSALGDPSAFPRDAHYLHLLANMAACASAVGDKPRCEQLSDVLAPYADLNTPSQSGYYLGSVSHFLGLLADALGRKVRAGTYFERAFELNHAMGYRAGVVRTLLAHGRLEQQLGHTRAARDLLVHAREVAREVGMSFALAECEAALAG